MDTEDQLEYTPKATDEKDTITSAATTCWWKRCNLKSEEQILIS